MPDTGTGASGFFPTALIDSTLRYWYSNSITGQYSAGNYALALWTNPGAGPANVTAELGYCNPDGSGYVLLASTITDVWAKPGNHITALVFSGVPAISLSNQVFRILITYSSGAQATMVYNGGTDFDSQLQTTEGNDGTCACGFTQINIFNGPADKLSYLTPIGSAEPALWDTDPAFDDSLWSAATTWINGGHPTINAAYPWSTWINTAFSNGNDEMLVRSQFSIPASATGITGTLYVRADDNSTLTLNGTVIQTEASGSISGQALRSIPITANLITGNNLLALHVNSPVISLMGYTYKIAMQYSVSCVSPTNTPVIVATATHSPTPSLTTSPTPSLSASPTPTFSVVPSLTVSPTPAATPVPVLPSPTPAPLLLNIKGPNPNPASGPLVFIPYLLSTAAEVTIEVFTVSGETVCKLTPMASSAGYSEQVWDLKNNAGKPVSSGIFIFRVTAVSTRGETQKDFSKLSVVR